jgi:hypothetical protein
MTIKAIQRVKETAGSWGKKPLETDGTSGAFNQVYERFEKLLVYAEREAFKSFMKPDNDDNNMFPSGVGFVVFMMQHNAFMSPGLRAAAIGWAKNAKTRPALKFGEMVRTYKPTLRRDLGVTVAILEAYSSGRLKAE